MMSKNKMFQKYLREEAFRQGMSLKNSSFITECRNRWKSLSDTQKEIVFTRRDGNQSLQSIDSSEEKTNIGSDQKNDAKKLEEVLEQNLIDKLVKYKTKEELMSTKLYLMSTNIQCIDSNNSYLPLEIGFVEYSIGKGIQRTYHSFINCGSVPLGYQYDAQSNSDKTHRIPVQNFAKASKEFDVIGEQILDLLAESRIDPLSAQMASNPMVVFAQTGQIDQNVGALQWLAQKWLAEQMKPTDERPIDGRPEQLARIKVLNVSSLLFNIYKKVKISRPLASCVYDMASNSFDYCLGTDCEYHESEECIYCALGVPKRMAYILSECMLRVGLRFKVLTTHFPELEYKRVNLFYELHNSTNESRDSDNDSNNGAEEAVVSTSGYEDFEGSARSDGIDSNGCQKSQELPKELETTSEEPLGLASGLAEQFKRVRIGRGKGRVDPQLKNQCLLTRVWPNSSDECESEAERVESFDINNN